MGTCCSSELMVKLLMPWCRGVVCCPVSSHALLARPPEVVHDTDGLGSGCVLCYEPDFLRGAFGERTIMICDTCEREFHVGCLRRHGRADLKEVRPAKGGGGWSV
eukprot:GHRQ01031665.1.p3 GENE.GHRQ01031665.1~~GHRQ01031665.1.p3  ORF type:complete len:105 (+),score=32.48 GHRQ01031665.1:453-767(+)